MTTSLFDPSAWPRQHVASAGSTNTDAAAWVIAGRSHGVWIRADEQTGGRGRRGRAWHSPVGNLHASVAFRVPTRTSGPPTALPLLAALALLEAVQQVTASQHLRIKWPNDLLLNGKKLAGLLLESASLGENAVYTIGFGVNCIEDLDSPLYPSTNLAASALPSDAGAIFNALTERLSHWLMVWLANDSMDTIRSHWLRNASGLGGPLTARFSDGEISGVFEGLDGEGYLQLRLISGELRQISAADIFLGNLKDARA